MNVQWIRSFDSQNRITFCTPGCEKLGVIILSLEGTMDTLLNACNQGIAAYIAKPFTPAVLIEKVNAYFAGPKKI